MARTKPKTSCRWTIACAVRVAVSGAAVHCVRVDSPWVATKSSRQPPWLSIKWFYATRSDSITQAMVRIGLSFLVLEAQRPSNQISETLKAVWCWLIQAGSPSSCRVLSKVWRQLKNLKIYKTVILNRLKVEVNEEAYLRISIIRVEYASLPALVRNRLGRAQQMEMIKKSPHLLTMCRICSRICLAAVGAELGVIKPLQPKTLSTWILPSIRMCFDIVL